MSLPVVNFLPWRQHRQHRRLRFGGLILAGFMVILLLAATCGHYASVLDHDIARLHSTANKQMAERLAQREQQWQLQRQQGESARRRQQQRQATRAWQQTLLNVSEQLPEYVWLTALSGHARGELVLVGHALTFSGLTALNEALQHFPHFAPGKPGNVSRDKQGLWQFSYQLIAKAPAMAPGERPQPQSQAHPRSRAVQWRNLRQLQVTMQSSGDDNTVMMPFSPFHFAADGGHLVSWQPVADGGEMVLDTRWSQIPELFSRAALCGMSVTAFSVHPQENELRLTLQLEANGSG